MNGILGTIITAVILLAVIVGVICYMVRQKKKGKPLACGMDCENCGSACDYRRN